MGTGRGWQLEHALGASYRKNQHLMSVLRTNVGASNLAADRTPRQSTSEQMVATRSRAGATGRPRIYIPCVTTNCGAARPSLMKSTHP
jgi:hypothetical protein